MRELSHSLHAFIEALHQNQLVRLSPSGRWYVVGKWARSFERWTGQETYSYIHLLTSFNSIFDSLEATPINFNQIAGIGASQRWDYHAYLSAAQSLKRFIGNEAHPAILHQLKALKMKMLGLLYRLEETNGGLHISEKNPILMQKLVLEAENWKREAKIFWKIDLSEGELHELGKAVAYAEFIKIIIGDKLQREDFFAWVLRDGLPVDIYVQFPALTKRLVDNNMCGRLGRMGQDFLRLHKQDSGDGANCLHKVVTLPFEGQEISLLDENKEVTFKGNYKLKIKQIFRVFRDKLKDLGNFEVFAEGILNWNSNCLGWWNNDKRVYELVDLDVSEWWRQLPVLEVLTVTEASNRFSAELDGQKWILAAKSARESINLDYDRCHAYVEMAVPTPDHQYYITYTFGKAAIQLPRNSWHRLFLFGAHVPASIVYPDETMYFTHRQQIGYTFELTDYEGRRLMDAFKEDIQRARSGNVVFQIEAENCGKWLQNHLEDHLGSERVPNLYRFPLLDAEPNGFMARFFSFFQGLPRFCRNRLFMLIHYPLGAWRGRWVVDKQGQKVWKSLLNSAFWKDAITYLPAYLHKQHEIGVFAEDPKRHKVWVENSPSSLKKTSEKPVENTPLFEDRL